MSDQDPKDQNQPKDEQAPETPEGATPEGSDETSGDGEASPSETSPEAEKPAGDRTAAEDLAAEALRAAQEAVSGINSGDAEGSSDGDTSDTDAASADADAAMAAMLEQQNQASGGADAQPVSMPAFQAAGLAGAPEGIDLLSDVNLDVKIELGRTRMYVEDVLKLSEGAVVELDKLAGDPVDIYVNQRLVARGEVLILNDNFCVRINEIVPAKPEAVAG
jgi:flagellar motor switch protein FliN/FliY